MTAVPRRHWLPLCFSWCKLLLFLPLSLSVSLSTSHFSFLAIYLKACGFLYLVCALDAVLCYIFQAAFRGGHAARCGCWYKERKICSYYLHFCLFPSGCIVLMCVCIFPIHAQTEKTPSLFSSLTSEWVPQKYPLQLSSLPHFSISPLSSTFPAPLALSCRSTSLSWCHSVSLVALRCKQI